MTWLVGLVAAMVAIVGGILALTTSAADQTAGGPIPAAVTSNNTNTSTTAGSTVGSTSDSASSTAPASAVAVGIAVGDCLDETGQLIQCNAVHRFEVIAASGESCDPAVVVEYLGGDPNLDVPRVDLGSAFDVCVASSADGTQWTGSVRGAFSAGSDPALADDFRRCRDDRVGAADVSCSVAHTGEYVGVPQGVVPDEDQCLEAAEAYAGVNFERGDKPELKVVTMPVTNALDGEPHCVIAVRGNNVLTGSIRNIRTTSLPLAPA